MGFGAEKEARYDRNYGESTHYTTAHSPLLWAASRTLEAYPGLSQAERPELFPMNTQPHV